MDLLKNAADVLKAVVPAVGKALGGPFGGMLATKLSTVLLGKPDATSEELSKVIAAASSDDLAKIKKIETEFLVSMKELDIDLAQIDAADRNAAREKEVVTKDWTPRFIAVLAIFSFFTYIGLVTFFPFSTKPNMEFVNLAMGWVGGVATSVVSYYFGSSSGSDQKNKTIDHMMTNVINDK